MKRFSMRAPDMPPKVRNLQTGSEFPTLYRGLMVSEGGLQRMFDNGFWADKGYMAFSRSKPYALDWALGAAAYMGVPVLFQINVRDVQRGTPWIWFRGTAEAYYQQQGGLKKKINFIPLGFNKGSAPEENEVLLPPGAILLKSATTITPPNREPYILVKGSYTFDPLYASRSR